MDKVSERDCPQGPPPQPSCQSRAGWAGLRSTLILEIQVHFKDSSAGLGKTAKQVVRNKAWNQPGRWLEAAWRQPGGSLEAWKQPGNSLETAWRQPGGLKTGWKQPESSLEGGLEARKNSGSCQEAAWIQAPSWIRCMKVSAPGSSQELLSHLCLR